MKTFLRFNQFLSFLTILVYTSVLMPPDLFLFAGFLTFFIPLFLFLHLLLFCYWVTKKIKYTFYSLITIAIGYPFFNATLSLHSNTNSTAGFSVMSYNVRVFNIYDHLNNNPQEPHTLLNWVSSDSSDIKCLQEFYDGKQGKKPFPSTKVLTKNGAYKAYVCASFTNDVQAKFGLAIFSRFPIIDKQKIPLHTNGSQNIAIYVDILLPSDDTIRVVNTHFQSISLDTDKLFNESSFEEKLRYLYRKMVKGFKNRTKQVNAVANFVASSPYPVILCSDLNDLPYSYAYYQLKQHLSNAFEQRGLGFDFTYNGKIPFLRIDQQFFSEKFEIKRFATLHQVTYSDHYPIKAWYQLQH